MANGSSFIALSIFLILGLAVFVGFVFLIVFIIKSLLKHNGSVNTNHEQTETAKSLGEALKNYRTECKMTQEFVAENLGVSRQAVSKWENGTSDPSTSNLIALAKLYEVSVEELLNCLK